MGVQVVGPVVAATMLSFWAAVGAAVMYAGVLVWMLWHIHRDRRGRH